MGYLFGTDGGGTHTTAWLADEKLTVLAKVQGGPSNPVKVGIAVAQRELAKVYRLAIRKAGVRPSKLDAFCAGLAGGDNADIQKKMLNWVRKAIPAHSHLFTTDANVTLAAGLGDSEGIIVIAGTGSIAFARNRRGRILRVGGWGNVFDDTGSGYDIGRKAVAAALSTYDGRGKPTRLTSAICRELGLRRISEVVAQPFTPRDIAALFPLVQRKAQGGDAVAQSLCHEAAGHLAELALTLVSRLEGENHFLPVVCSGGVFRSSPAILGGFAKRVLAAAPYAHISLLHREPVEGALVLASKLPKSQAAKKRKP